MLLLLGLPCNLGKLMSLTHLGGPPRLVQAFWQVLQQEAPALLPQRPRRLDVFIDAWAAHYFDSLRIFVFRFSSVHTCFLVSSALSLPVVGCSSEFSLSVSKEPILSGTQLAITILSAVSAYLASVAKKSTCQQTERPRCPMGESQKTTSSFLIRPITLQAAHIRVHTSG